MDNRAQHEREVLNVQDKLCKWIEGNHSSARLCLAKQNHHSNIVRSHDYKKSRPSIGIDQLNKVISVDLQRRVAVVEPRVTMEALARATLAQGMIPAVVPEFKGITVGGAINGAAIESSSHRYGQFNDICKAYTILLGDGSLVKASREENADLFYGMTGCYGTLGFLMSAEVELVPCKGWVLLEMHHFRSVAAAVAFIGEQHRREGGPEYIEGIIYGKEDIVVIVGDQEAEADIPKGVERLSLLPYNSPWYYQVARERCTKETYKLAMPSYDYLFRHDRGAFWMGGYALQPSLLARYIFEVIGYCPQWIHKMSLGRRTEAYEVGYPGGLFRTLFGGMMGSESLYGFLHRHTEQWFADHFAIQDYYLPENRATAFTEHVLDAYGVVPLWLCPVKATSTPQWLSPHYADGSGIDLLIDVGVYGMPAKMQAGEAISRALDTLAVERGGRKMLYSYSYYTPEQFWGIYPQDKYRALRSKYGADAFMMDITDKVLMH